MENNKPQPKNRIVLPISAIIFSVIFMGINYRWYLFFLPFPKIEGAGALAIIFLFFFSLPIGLIALILSIISIIRTPKNKTESILKTIAIIIFLILALPLAVIFIGETIYVITTI